MEKSVVNCFLRTVWNYILLYALGAWYLVKEILVPHKQPSGLIRQKGRVALITGGSRGIGLETARQLLKLDLTVVLAGRNKAELESAIAGLRAEGVEGGTTEFLELDLSNLESIRSFVSEFKALKLPLHIIINNAGIMFSPFKLTVDGFESHWSVNYLGHFLLTHLLMPNLLASGSPENPSRIVSVASSVHFLGTIDFDDINGLACYDAKSAYAQSKLAQVMFTSYLSWQQERKGNKILVNCVHPGVVATQLFEHVTWVTTFPWLAKLVLKTPQQGSDTVVHVAVSSNVKVSGRYFENCTITDPALLSKNVDIQHRLFQTSCEMLGIVKFGE